MPSNPEAAAQAMGAKPCPFCGGEPIDDDERHGDGLAHFWRCRSCAAEGPWTKTRTDALIAWNRRVVVDSRTIASVKPTDVTYE
jgi:Lar family restriction alleviation protein